MNDLQPSLRCRTIIPVTTTMTIQEYTFRAKYLPEFAAGIAKLKKVADKLGLKPITFTEGERFWKEINIGSELYPCLREVEHVTVQVAGENPQLPGGWQFLGSIEHDIQGTGENMVHGDDERVSTFREAKANCDHCGFNRNRKNTMILVNDEGTITQVGSTCLKDFLGYHSSPSSLVAWLGYVPAIVEEIEGVARTAHDVPVDYFMTVTAAVVRTLGWSAKSSGSVPTVEYVQTVCGIYFDRRLAEDLRNAQFEITEADEVEGKATVEWARNLDSYNDYLNNVRVSLLGEYINPKHMGIAASAVSAWHKEQGRLAKYEVEKAQRAASEFIGTAGQKVELDVVVKFVRAIDGQYGVTYLVEMEDAAGNIIKTFNSGDFGYKAEKGQQVRIKGSIKSLETYNDVKSTMLTRVKAVG